MIRKMDNSRHNKQMYHNLEKIVHQPERDFHCNYKLYHFRNLNYIHYLGGKLVSHKVNARTLLLVAIFPMCLGLAVLGWVTSIEHFVICLSFLSFFEGLYLIAEILFINHFSNKESIGVNLGIIGISNLLGSLVGGFVVGPVLQNYGYQTGFLVFASFLFLTCLLTFLIDRPTITNPVELKERFVFTKKFGLVLLSFVLAVMLIHVFLFSFSLSMKGAGYNLSDISLYSAFGTALALPTPYLFGMWTKKYKPKNLMILLYVLMGSALLCLLLPKLTATILISIALMSVLAFSGRAVIVALVFPWFTDKQLPMAQAYMGTAAWFAAIIGYLFSGFSLQHYGLTNTLFAGTAIAFLSIVILHFSVSSTNNDIINEI